MDQHLKERLIGAVLLVGLGVWLIPWVLDGPAPGQEDTSMRLELPAPDEPAPVRTEVIDLRSPAQDAAGVAPQQRPAQNAPRQSDPQDAGDGRGADIVATQSGRDRAAGAADHSAEPAQPRTAEPAEARTAEPAEAGAAADSSRTAADPAPTAAAPREAEPASGEPAAATARSGADDPAASGDWMVQLGSFGEQVNAERLAERVAGIGFDPEISTYRSGGRVMHRVRVGPHETRDRAEAAASSLSAHGFVAQVVTAE